MSVWKLWRSAASAVALTFSTVATAPAQPGLSFQPIRFEILEGRKRTVDAERATFTVPADHDRAETGAPYTLAITRFRGSSPQSSAPIVYLAGGPGGSGSRTFAGDRFDFFMALRPVGDLLALDQRGVFGSTPYPVCPGSWSHPLDQPLQRSSLMAALRPFAEQCNTFWREKGVDLRTFHTMASVQDLEVLRTQLGVTQLRLLATSYGTHLALAYMRAHPERVERAVLLGTEGPDDTWKSPAIVDAAVRTLDTLVAADRRWRDQPLLSVRMRALLSRLDSAPVTVAVRDRAKNQTVHVAVGGLDARLVFYDMMTERHNIAQLPRGVAQALRGDYAHLADAAYARRTNRRELAMALSTDCASGGSQARLHALRSTSAAMLLGDINLPFPEMCEFWPHRDLGAAFRAAITSTVPVLFVAGSLDARTPVQNVEALLPHFPNGRRLLIEGAGHDDDLFLASPQIVESVRMFLAGEVPPPTIRLAPISFAPPP